MDPELISVVIPFFNEMACVPVLLAELDRACASVSASWEWWLVDDGSGDGTRSALAGFAPALSGAVVHVAGFAQNMGQAAALYFGIRQAGGSIVITMDGDGQNDPTDIPRLLEVLRGSGVDMVAGVRAKRRDSWLRTAMSRLANGIRSRVLGDGVSDTGCGLKAFRREVADALIPIRTLYSFMPAMVVAAGFRVGELEVAHRPRKTGVSKYGLGVFLWRPILDMMGMWWFVHRCIRQAKIRRESSPE